MAPPRRGRLACAVANWRQWCCLCGAIVFLFGSTASASFLTAGKDEQPDRPDKRPAVTNKAFPDGPGLSQDLVESERYLDEFGSPRYSDVHPMPSWDDLQASTQGSAGAICDPASPRKACGTELVCRQGVCRHCRDDDECPMLHRCETHFSTGSLCVPIEKKAWELALERPSEFFCAILIFFASLMAAAAGTGGGGMFVPLFILLTSMKTETAVPTSQCMILCGSCVNLMLFIGQRHPLVWDEAKIDYDCVVLLAPMLCLGVTLGVLLHQMSPQWFLLGLLCITLGMALYRTGKKAIKEWRTESASAPAGGQVATNPTEDNSPKEDYFQNVRELCGQNAWQIMAIVVLWLVLLACCFHGLPICTPHYAFFISVMSISLVALTLFFVVGIGPCLAREKEEGDGEKMLVAPVVKSQSRDDAVDWVGARAMIDIIRFPVVGFLAGGLGGLLGIGGGMIMSPVLVEVGMHSEAVQATTAVFVFISSSLATIQFLVLGMHVWHYALMYSIITVFATLLGQFLCDVYVRKHKRYSMITMAITGVLLFSLTALMIVGSMQVAEDFENGNQLWFSTSRLCQTHDNLGTIAVDVAPAQAWPQDLPQYPIPKRNQLALSCFHATASRIRILYEDLAETK
eukprot:gnl/TRDRNA2_/TRDRNA2_167633_c2_seq3.p1 gnl/TRDRNA2_/TRDRNA2_167633_c2~~gnl/TRDRNA2_/TRDRNA2_167633_c2_seq3.p1  ORF type:complete len:629 (+),score=86.28 gnl/TRDRNA2_/TRDRNA2_167633_c2_seq3:118-2004(+)